jgi:hypothetical protein
MSLAVWVWAVLLWPMLTKLSVSRIYTVGWSETESTWYVGH